jgi:hypothetical protein
MKRSDSANEKERFCGRPRVTKARDSEESVCSADVHSRLSAFIDTNTAVILGVTLGAQPRRTQYTRAIIQAWDQKKETRHAQSPSSVRLSVRNDVRKLLVYAGLKLLLYAGNTHTHIHRHTYNMGETAAGGMHVCVCVCL